MPTLGPRQLDLLATTTDESGRHLNVQLSGSFAYDETQDAPLKTLIGMGSASLKLYLTLVLATRNPPHTLYRGSSSARFARMLGFDDSLHDDPASAGTRRIQRALTALADKGFIDREKRPGRLDQITVHAKRPGKGRPHTLPYVTLPLDLWRLGWIVVMSNPALAVYIALRRHCAGDEDRPLYVTPANRRDGYRLSEDTWAKGLRDLEALGILTMIRDNPRDREAVSRERWVYQLHSDKLEQPPPRNTHPRKARKARSVDSS